MAHQGTRQEILQKFWTDPDTYTTVLLAMFLDRYGTTGTNWSPETVALEVQDDFRVELPQLNFDRLMAGIQLLTTDAFYKSLPDFISLCNVLSGTPYDPNLWDPADSLEVAWGLTEGLLIAPPDDEDEEPFNDEIRHYIGAVLDSEGIINAPDILKLALRDAMPDGIGLYSDDPTMFNAIYDFEQSKTQDINRGIRQHLTALTQQLDALPLDTGNTQNSVQLLLRSQKG